VNELEVAYLKIEVENNLEIMIMLSTDVSNNINVNLRKILRPHFKWLFEG